VWAGGQVGGSVRFHSRIIAFADACPLLGERAQSFYTRILSPTTSEETAETAMQRDSAVTDRYVRRLRLRLHLEDNAAPARQVAGTMGFVDVEVSA
jgi:hypothetical protein